MTAALGRNFTCVKIFTLNFLSVPLKKFLKFFETFSKNFRFWLGGAAPQTTRIFAGGAKLPQTPPLNGLSSHLIEAAKRGRLDQMLFFLFCAADDTGAAVVVGPPTTARRPSAGRPTTVHGINDSTVPSFSA